MKNIKTILILILLAYPNLLAQSSIDDLPPVPPDAQLQITNLIYSLNYLQSLNKIKKTGLQQGNDLIIGDDDPNETVTITGSYLLNGDLIIINNGRLILDSAHFQIDGDIQISGTGELNASGGTFEVIENFIYEHQALVLESGVLNFDGVQFHSSGQSWQVSVAGNGKYYLKNSEISDGFITTGLFGQSEAQIINNQLPGEFLCFGENNLEFRNNDWLLFWLVLFDSSIVDISLPGDSLLTGWQFDENQPGVQGDRKSVV